MPDQDGGKLARVVTHEGTSEIWVELLRIGWFTSESDAIATCDLLNSHVSRLLTAERKRVLEMVQKAWRCTSCPDQGWYAEQVGGCDPDGENDTREAVQVQCEWCYTTENSLFNVLSRLEGEGK